MKTSKLTFQEIDEKERYLTHVLSDARIKAMGSDEELIDSKNLDLVFQKMVKLLIKLDKLRRDCDECVGQMENANFRDDLIQAFLIVYYAYKYFRRTSCRSHNQKEIRLENPQKKLHLNLN